MKKLLSICVMGLILNGCGGKKNNPVPTLPGQASLIAPSLDEICTTGTVISNTETSIHFSWNTSTNTGSYTLVINNLLTSAAITQNTTETQINVNLSRNTPFSWYIISKSASGSATSQSATWKFYNSGPGVTTYAPFPAEISTPKFGEIVTAVNGMVDLTWQGSSVDPASIANYDVYLGTGDSPGLAFPEITTSYLHNMPVVSGSTYYWRVITRDKTGDTSDSGVYQFTVK